MKCYEFDLFKLKNNIIKFNDKNIKKWNPDISKIKINPNKIVFYILLILFEFVNFYWKYTIKYLIKKFVIIYQCIEIE